MASIIVPSLSRQASKTTGARLDHAQARARSAQVRSLRGTIAAAMSRAAKRRSALDILCPFRGAVRQIRPRIWAEFRRLILGPRLPRRVGGRAGIPRRACGHGGAGERFSIERNTAANIAGDRNSDLGLVENAI